MLNLMFCYLQRLGVITTVLPFYCSTRSIFALHEYICIALLPASGQSLDWLFHVGDLIYHLTKSVQLLCKGSCRKG